MPCIVVRVEGKVVASNDHARSLLGRETPIRISTDGILECSASGSTDRLHATISRVAGGREIENVVISCDGNASCCCMRALIAKVGDVGPARAVLVILLRELACHGEGKRRVLMEQFGLTSGEIRVALRVAGGQRLMEIAQELGLSITTVRTHLARIFAKTGTSRQADLVRLVLDETPSP